METDYIKKLQHKTFETTRQVIEKIKSSWNREPYTLTLLNSLDRYEDGIYLGVNSDLARHSIKITQNPISDDPVGAIYFTTNGFSFHYVLPEKDYHEELFLEGGIVYQAIETWLDIVLRLTFIPHYDSRYKEDDLLIERVSTKGNTVMELENDEFTVSLINSGTSFGDDGVLESLPHPILQYDAEHFVPFYQRTKRLPFRFNIKVTLPGKHDTYYSSVPVNVDKFSMFEDTVKDGTLLVEGIGDLVHRALKETSDNVVITQMMFEFLNDYFTESNDLVKVTINRF